MNTDIKPVKKKNHAFIGRMAILCAVGLVLFFIQSVPYSILTVSEVTPNMLVALAVAVPSFSVKRQGAFSASFREFFWTFIQVRAFR